MAKQFTKKEWKELKKKLTKGEITQSKLLKLTEGQYEHPDGWEDCCLCDLCKGYA
jgi:hypothetical protein